VSTITVGVDVASQPAGTAACRVRWEARGATLEEVSATLDDARLAAVLSSPADKIGVDVPLGWPDDFVAGVSRHHAGGAFGAAPGQRLWRRETDRWVADPVNWAPAKAGQIPLSVSTDRIAYPAMRVARLLGEISGERPDRSGAGAIVEVYPAAALRRWGLRHRGYKGTAGRVNLAGLIDTLRRRCPWLEGDSATWQVIVRGDHAFDALVCALVARAHLAGGCDPVPEELRDAARREGWIAVPLPGSLEQLAG
jgi:hypothetical protein